jgi:hypothetical protein
VDPTYPLNVAPNRAESRRIAPDVAVDVAVESAGPVVGDRLAALDPAWPPASTKAPSVTR